MTNRGDERSSVLRRRASLRSYFSWLLERGHVESTPPRVFWHPRPPSSASSWCVSTGQPLGDDWAKTRGRARPRGVRAALGAGLRVSELCDLNLDRHRFFQRPGARLGQGRKEAWCPCTVKVSKPSSFGSRTLARTCCARTLPATPCFSIAGRSDSDPARYDASWITRRTRSRAPPRSAPHLRHAPRGRGSGPPCVQELLRPRESLTTTQIYTHVSKSRLQKVHHDSHPRGK